MISRLCKMTDLVSRYSAEMAGGILVAMVVLVFVDVAIRTLFGRSIMIVAEYAGYMVVVVSFMGFARALATKRHITINFAVSRLPSLTRKRIEIVAYGLAAVFMSYVTAQIARMAYSSWAEHVLSQSVIRTPLFIPQSLMLVGAILLTFQFLACLFSFLQPGEHMPFVDRCDHTPSDGSALDEKGRVDEERRSREV